MLPPVGQMRKSSHCLKFFLYQIFDREEINMKWYVKSETRLFQANALIISIFRGIIFKYTWFISLARFTQKSSDPTIHQQVETPCRRL